MKCKKYINILRQIIFVIVVLVAGLVVHPALIAVGFISMMFCFVGPVFAFATNMEPIIFFPLLLLSFILWGLMGKIYSQI